MKSLAILIGNSAYTSSIPLPNPGNDATDLGKKLEILGFDVSILLNSTNEEMEKDLLIFGDQLESYEVGLFFFAGHGMQIKGENYLFAINTKMNNEITAKHSSLPLNQVIEIMEKSGVRTKIIILDACRDNPFEFSWSRSATNRGLAPVYAPKGTIVAFATSPGQLSSDGNGRNGAYTSGLLSHICDQDIPIEEMFKRTRNTVSLITNGEQTSWEHTSLMGSFYFNNSAPDSRRISVYGKFAKEDKFFTLNLNDKCHQIIQKLKSHDWYSQNPAIDKIDSLNFNSTDKDSLFILGRNIYQVACGGSKSGLEYLENLPYHLKAHKDEHSFHILNGILYEIYFNNVGSFRKKAKSNCFDMVFIHESSVEFKNSFSFIASELENYYDLLFYVPGSKRSVIIDILTEPKADNVFAIQNICLEGDEILRKNESYNFTFSTLDYRTFSYGKFEEFLIFNTLIPRNRIRFKFDIELPRTSQIEFPEGFYISRLPIQ